MSSEARLAESTAPGKAILVGEHAVVHGRPAIAIPVTQVGTTVRVRPGTPGVRRFISRAAGLDVEMSQAPDGFWGTALMAALAREIGEIADSFNLSIESSIPVASGLGSGAALAVAAARAVAAYSGAPLPDEAANRVAFEVEKIHHGTPSGIDNTTVTYARPVFFRRGSPPETFRPAAPLHLVIGLTGIASPTRQAVADVRAARDREPDRFEKIFDAIAGIADRARTAIEAGSLEELGSLMDQNHDWLCAMTVSSPELDRLVDAARNAGALGAKLSGGGRGGNMIALARPSTLPTLEKALQRAGAVHTIRTSVETA